MQERQDGSRIDEPLQRFPPGAKRADLDIGRSHSERHEHEEGKPTRQDVECGKLAAGQGNGAFVNRVQDRMGFAFTKHAGDFLFDSREIAGMHEQLGTDEIQDPELALL